MENNTDLQTAVQMANHMKTLEENIVSMEQKLAEKKAQFRDMEQRILPEILESVGVNALELDTGETIRITNTAVGRLSAQTREAAINWLVDNGHEGLLKKKFEVALDRNQTEQSQAIMDFLSSTDIPFNLKEDVHHSTLNAFIREQIEENPDFPRDLFNVFEVKKAVFNRAP